MAGVNVIETTDTSFEADVLKSSVPVLVDFWAVWCGPCRALSPIIDDLATENAGKIKVCKLNTDDSPNTASKYGIRGIPTVMLFKNGEVIDQITGVMPKVNFQNMINKSLS